MTLGDFTVLTLLISSASLDFTVLKTCQSFDAIEDVAQALRYALAGFGSSVRNYTIIARSNYIIITIVNRITNDSNNDDQYVIIITIGFGVVSSPSDQIVITDDKNRNRQKLIRMTIN